MRKEVATVVVLDKDEFLILKRSKTSRGAGFWNFPGGSVEEGESFHEAAARELKEESNLNVIADELEYLGTLTTKYLNIHFFITDEYTGKVELNLESDDYKWISMDEIDNYLFVGGGNLHPDLLESMKHYIGG